MFKLTAEPRRRPAGRRMLGQSLTEFALALPILLLTLAGLLEVANLLLTYNRALLAAREGARIAAAGATDGTVRQTIQSATLNSLRMEQGQMEVWIVRPMVRTNTSPWSWQDWNASDETCIFPVDTSTGNELCENTAMNVSKTAVMNQIQQITTAQSGQIDGERVTIVAIYYEAQTLLNLPFFSMPGLEDGRIPFWVFAVMRQETVDQTTNQLQAGCSAYPIAINEAVQTTEGVSLALASEGDRLLDIPTGDSGYRFLLWRNGGSGLSVTLLKPGDESLTEYLNPANLTDNQLHRTDSVLIQSNTSGAVTRLNEHKTAGRTLRVILFSAPAAETGNGPGIIVTSFAIVRVDSGWDGSLSALDLQFVRLDFSCGYY